MPTLTFIFGPCGSGKSHVANGLGSVVLDEDSSFTCPPDGSLSPEKYTRLRELLTDGQDCAVVEATLYYDPLRQAAMRHLEGIPDVEVEWIGFELDRETANHNCMHRTNKGDGPGHVRINNGIRDEQYTFPDGADRRPIYRLPVPDAEAESGSSESGSSEA